MTVKEVIESRRAYRVLEPAEITSEVITDLVEAAQLVPSCYNHQPWRFIFVSGSPALEKIFTTLSEGNRWAYKASLVIAVFGKKENDCVVNEREYYLFDLGMASAAIVLRATEIGLVAHPIAGFSEEQVKTILEIPPENKVITLIIVGKKSYQPPGSEFSEKQIASETRRPPRLGLEQLYSINQYSEKLG